MLDCINTILDSTSLFLYISVHGRSKNVFSLSPVLGGWGHFSMIMWRALRIYVAL